MGRRKWMLAVLLLAGAGVSHSQRAPGGPAGPSAFDAFYTLGPDSLSRDGVPKGQILGPFQLPSKAFPGVEHTYHVYVPAQYKVGTPASLMIFNDGQAFKAPEGSVRAQNVLDNLIYRREIPVMIAVFINPGRRPDQPEPTPHHGVGWNSTWIAAYRTFCPDRR